ncbi:MAG: branched-chain amino acid ABC transporter permease, partial [Bacteroidota bacterium]
MVLTLFISGLLSGSLYALMALALSLSYRSSGVSNFAQGDSATLGAYLLLLMSSSWQWSLWLALPLVLLAAFAIGWLTERLLRPIPAEDHLKSVILTLGIQIFLFGLISSIWGPEQQALPILDDGTVLQISSWQFNRGDILSILIALSLMSGGGFVLRYSRLGIMISASQQNPKEQNPK